MKKQIFATALSLSLMVSLQPVSAEQPAAETYRQIFQSGTFYVEYKDKYTTRIISEKDGQRMERTNYETSLSWMKFLNPLGMLFGGGTPKHPEVLHKDGKYYQFTEDDKATVCTDEQLEEENLNPREGWSTIGQKLALPTELSVFFWTDPYRTQSAALSAPEVTWSGKKTYDGKEYDCDRYTSPIHSAAGDTEANYIYDMLYQNGRLVEIRSYIERNGEGYPINTLEIKKIEGKVPEGLFKIKKNTKVYAAGTGDMNDLLEQPEQIGTLEGI